MKIIRDLLQDLYARRLRKQLENAPLPRHVAMIMDGNRRWARQMGLGNVSLGHHHGAEHLQNVMGWCEEIGIRHMTVFLASADNLHKRDDSETHFLLEVIERVVIGKVVEESDRWQVHVAGQLDLLPDSTRYALKLAEEETRDRGAEFHLTMAVGYDGRNELVDALRSLLDDRARAGVSIEELASTLTEKDISGHLYTTGQPDPDLVIRTSGELRMSGFLLWQAAYAELYFCDVYWPGFRYLDFLRALRSYSARHRRYGA